MISGLQSGLLPGKAPLRFASVPGSVVSRGWRDSKPGLQRAIRFATNIMSNRAHRLRADTHVHFHSAFDEGRFLEAAAKNLCEECTNAESVHGAICLTETVEASWFGRLSGVLRGREAQIPGWLLEETAEPNSVVATDDFGRSLAIIAGRQIVCRERLEVLALGCEIPFEDGQPIRDVLRSVHNHGALAVVPWGFGKWTGRRGDLVRELLHNPPCRFFLGDNGGRPARLREPAMFAEAAALGISVLPGTDPFPFAWDGERVGSYGLEWEGAVDRENPFQGIKLMVSESIEDSIIFGHLQGIPGFLRSQLAIHLKSVLSKWRK